MPLMAILAMTAVMAHAETGASDRILLSRTHAHSGPSKLELLCPAGTTSSCEVRRYLNGAVVAESAVTRAKSTQIFKDFLDSPAGTQKSEQTPGQTIHWEVAYGAQHASGGIVRSEKLARPVVSLEAELLALVRKR